jgi:hypothetical protein
MPSLRSSLIVMGAVLLGGCQSLSSQDPLAQDAADVPAECRWTRSDNVSRERWLRAAVDELEARDYSITNTEAALGVISAEQRTRRPGLRSAGRPWFGFSTLWGGFGSRSGVGVGYGMRFGDDPVEVERLSVVVDEDAVTVTRDVSVIDADGYLVDARPTNRPDFCRDFSASIESRLLVEGPLQ